MHSSNARPRGLRLFALSSLAAGFAACAASPDLSGFGANGTDAGPGVTEAGALATDGGTSPGGNAAGPDATLPIADGGNDASRGDGASAFDAASVDAAWFGRPPAIPLVVRSPYVSTWLPADEPNATWPTFWTASDVKGMAGIARIDGAAYVFLGDPAGLTTTTTTMGFVSRSLTPTKTEFVFSGGGVSLTVDFLSPVEIGNLQRQSAPIGYVTATASSLDGSSHAVSVYFDISGEWAYGVSNSTEQVAWNRESVPHTGGDLVVQSFAPSPATPFTEVDQYPSWGTAFLAAASTSALTVQIGYDVVVRSLAASQGSLAGTVDITSPGLINESPSGWPVLGYSFALGTVTPASPSAPVTLVIGQARNPAVNYLNTATPPLWASYWTTWEDMVSDEFDDAPNAFARAAQLDGRVVSDAVAAGGEDYAALCTLALRQAYGGTELVGTPSAPWLMLKEISSDGNVSTVDVVYPASPAFLYTNPVYLKLLLDPLLAYAESGHWPQPFAEHDLGPAYPVASGHDDGGGENMPIEETANMLIMMAAYVQRAAPATASAYANQHYGIAKLWAQYLEANTLDPQCQNQTDDFTGPICHSVNLALKGIVGVGAMSVLAQAAGNTADQAAFLGEAKSLMGSWATMAQGDAGTHLLLVYDEGQDAGLGMPIQSSWSLKYNALYDRILGLNLIPASLLQEEALWYSQQAQAYGVDLDPRNTYTKSDWELWTAGAIDDDSVRQLFVQGVYGYVTTSTARVPFGDLYYTANGQWDAFQARPVQGGMFSLLARSGTSIVGPQ